MAYGDKLRHRLAPARIRAKLANEIRRALAPLASRVAPLRNETFTVWDEEHRYFVHSYNTTWRNERAVEVPIARSFLAHHGNGHGMEFGNVLAHYGGAGGDVVLDKYEGSPGVVNVDVVDYAPPTQFDYIVSLSTIEHVGWDERPRDTQKVLLAFDRLRAMLAPGGRMLISAPIGHNATLDDAVREGRWPVLREATLARSADGRWLETNDPPRHAYGTRGHQWAHAVWFAEVGADAADS
jgi:hypothetical protein